MNQLLLVDITREGEDRLGVISKQYGFKSIHLHQGHNRNDGCIHCCKRNKSVGNHQALFRCYSPHYQEASNCLLILVLYAVSKGQCTDFQPQYMQIRNLEKKLGGGYDVQRHAKILYCSFQSTWQPYLVSRMCSEFIHLACFQYKST